MPTAGAQSLLDKEPGTCQMPGQFCSCASSKAGHQTFPSRAGRGEPTGSTVQLATCPPLQWPLHRVAGQPSPLCSCKTLTALPALQVPGWSLDGERGATVTLPDKLQVHPLWTPGSRLAWWQHKGSGAATHWMPLGLPCPLAVTIGLRGSHPGLTSCSPALHRPLNQLARGASRGGPSPTPRGLGLHAHNQAYSALGLLQTLTTPPTPRPLPRAPSRGAQGWCAGSALGRASL